jgi:predicted nucleotidyltransferase
MLTQKSAIEIVRSFAKQVNESGVTLRRVVLFGSYANNTQREWSDIRHLRKII